MSSLVEDVCMVDLESYSERGVNDCLESLENLNVMEVVEETKAISTHVFEGLGEDIEVIVTDNDKVEDVTENIEKLIDRNSSDVIVTKDDHFENAFGQNTDMQLKQSTESFCVDTQVTVVSSAISDIEAAGEDSGTRPEDNLSPILSGDQPQSCYSPVTMAEESTVAPDSINQEEQETKLKAEKEAEAEAAAAAAKAAEEETKARVEAEEKAKAEEEAKLKAEAAAAAKAEEEAKARVEAEQKAKAEEEAKAKAEEEARAKAAEESRLQAEKERKRKEEEAKLKAEEEASKAALETFDSFDVIGDLVDKENQEQARQRRDRATSAVYKSSSTLVVDNSLMQGKEKSELGKELWEASSQGKAGPVKMLLQAGADPNFIVRTGLMSTSSPLVTASCRGHTNVIDSLLEHPDLSVNMAVSGGWTALMWASWYGHTEVVQQLLTRPGINKDKLNNAGKNAVMYAAEAGRVEVCKILLDGVENYEPDEQDRAVRKNRLDRLLDQALKAGCDVPLAKMVLGKSNFRTIDKYKYLFIIFSIERREG